MLKISPVIKPIIETFQKVYYQTLMFANNPDSAINGLLVMGDAGVGKTHFVTEALRDAGVQKNVEMIKGGTLTAASLYVKLFLNRDKNRIIVFDDVDLLGHPEKNKIIPMILGAAQEGRKRQVTWSTARRNALMEEYDVPEEFYFDGNIIFITNYTKKDIQDKAKQWTMAFESRFNSVECIFKHEQKYMYTKHLVEDKDSLGTNCPKNVHTYIDTTGKEQNGYPQHVIDEAMDFIDVNYENLSDITPRVAIKIADTIHYNNDPHMKRVMLSNLVK